MAFPETLDKLDAGQAIRKEFLDAVVDALLDLNSRAGQGQEVPNASLDLDADADGLPDGWTRTLLSAGAGSRETTAAHVSHGEAAYTFTRTAGAGNGGGQLDSGLVPVGPGLFELRWYYRATAALKSTVAVRWYDRAQSFLSSTTLATVELETMRRGCYASCTVPDGARYAQIRATGGATDVDVAGAATFDGFQYTLTPNRPVFAGSGAVKDVVEGWATYQTIPGVWIPSNATTLKTKARIKAHNGSYECLHRVKVGAYTGTEIRDGAGNWMDATSVLTLDASLKGTYQDVELQFAGAASPNEGYREIVSDTGGGFEENLVIV